MDDGSTDDTWKVVARYRGLVTAIRQDRRGVSAARNEALRRARGEFIALLDADDVYLPEKLELQVQALDRYPEAGLVFTDLVEFTDAGKILGRGLLGTPFFRQWLRAHRRGSVSVGWMYRETLIQMCVPGGSCAMIRRECLDAVGDYHPALPPGAEDYDLNLRLAQRYPVVILDRVLYRYRWREDSASGPFADRLRKWAELHEWVRNAHLRALPADLPTEAWAALRQYYWDALALDRVPEARLLFRPVLRHQPRKVKAAVSYLGSYLPRRTRRLVRALGEGVLRARRPVVGQGAKP